MEPNKQPKKDTEEAPCENPYMAKDFDELLGKDETERVYPQLPTEAEEAAAAREREDRELEKQNEDTRRRMAQYASATKEKLDMMAKFLEEIDEKAAKLKEEEKEGTGAAVASGSEDGVEQSHFYHLVDDFRRVQMERANSLGEDNKRAAAVQAAPSAKKIWTLRKFENKHTVPCNICERPIGFSVECTTAQFNSAACDELAQKLHDLRTSQSARAVRACRKSVAKCRVQLHIAEYIASTQNFARLSAEAPVIAVGAVQQTPELVKEMAYMRHMLEVLFHFERTKPAEYVEDLADAGGSSSSSSSSTALSLMADFYGSLEAWICEIGAYVLRLASYDDHMFLLQQLLTCPGCGVWGGPALVQFPPVESWDAKVAEHFKDVLLAVARPERRALWAEKDKLGNGKGKNSWGCAMSERGRLVEARGLQPLETDLLALYEQIPIGPLCSFLLYNPPLYETFVRSIFDILKALCEAIKMCEEYTTVTKRITKTVTIFLTVVAKHNEDLVNAGPAAAVERQKQFNTCFVSVVYSILSLGNSSLWQFLAGLPFGALDEQGAWQTLGLLHFVDIKNLPQSQADWDTLFTGGADTTAKDASAVTPYESFVKVCEGNFTNGTYLVGALGGLGGSPRASEAIELVCLDTLYEAGLIDKRTRANLLKSIVGAIAAILERHPDRIAHLLDRIDDALSRNMHAEAAEYLFSKLPLDIWAPPLDTIWAMGSWAASSSPSSEDSNSDSTSKPQPSSSSSAAAITAKKVGPGRRFFERINWSSPQVSTDANLCAALAILGVWKHGHDEYMASRALDIPAQRRYSATLEWCWSQLLRLRYARPGGAGSAAQRTLRPTLPRAEDSEMDREMRELWGLAAAHASGVADGSVPAKSIEAILLFVGIALRDQDDVVASLTAKDSNGRQEVVALLSALVGTGSPSATAGAALLLSQFVSLTVQATAASSEAYLYALTPAFITLVEKIVRSNNGSDSWLNPLSWGWGSRGNAGPGPREMASLLVAGQIEQNEGNAFIALKCAEFWIAAATRDISSNNNSNNRNDAWWLSDSAHTAIFESVLSAWFCFVDRAAPAPFVRGLVDKAAHSAEGSLLPQSPVTRTMIGTVWSDDLAKVPFLTFQVLLTEAVIRAENAGGRGNTLDRKVFEQWFNYGVMLDSASEVNVLYWDVIVHMYFSVLLDPPATTTSGSSGSGFTWAALTREFASKMEKRLRELEEAFLASSSAERQIVRFFRSAAAAVKKSPELTKQKLLASFEQQQQQQQQESAAVEEKSNAYDPLFVQCVTQSPVAAPGRLFVQCVDVGRILSVTPSFVPTRAPVKPEADKTHYYDRQLAKKTVSNAALPPPLRVVWPPGGRNAYRADTLDVRNGNVIIGKVEWALGTISASAESEYRRINALLHLDSEYISLIRVAYTSESRYVKLTDVCPVCNRSVSAGLMQDKAERNEDAVAKMDANRKLARDYSHIPAVDPSLSPSFACLEHVAAALSRASAEEVAAVNGNRDRPVLCMCKNVLAKLATAYALPHVAWCHGDLFIELIAAVASVIVRDSPADAYTMLESALTGSNALPPQPLQTFQPWHSRTAFSAMLERTLRECTSPGVAPKARERACCVLKACFRVDKWLLANSSALHASVDERRALLDVLLSPSFGAAAAVTATAAPAELCTFVVGSVRNILAFAFPELTEHAVEQFFAVTCAAVSGSNSGTMSSKVSCPAIVLAMGNVFWSTLSTGLPLERVALGKAQNIVDIIGARLAYLRSSSRLGVFASMLLGPSVVAFVNALFEKAVYPALLQLRQTGSGADPYSTNDTVAGFVNSYMTLVTPIASYDSAFDSSDDAKSAVKAVYANGVAEVLGNRLYSAFIPMSAARVAAPSRLWTLLAEVAHVLTSDALIEGRTPVWFQDAALSPLCTVQAWEGWRPTFDQLNYLYKLLSTIPVAATTPKRWSAHFPRLMLALCLKVDWRAQQPYFDTVEFLGLILHFAVLSLRLAPAGTLASDNTEAGITALTAQLQKANISTLPLGSIFGSIYANILQPLRDVPDPDDSNGLRWRLIFLLAGSTRVDASETTPESRLERLQAFADFYANVQAVAAEPHFGVFVPLILSEHLGVWKDMGFKRLPAAEGVVISLFGAYNAACSRPAAFHDAVAAYLTNGKIEEAPYFANYACRSVLSTQRLPLFVDTFLSIYFTKYANWQRASAAVQVPEIGRHDFLDAAVDGGAALTLYATALQIKAADPAEFTCRMPQWATALKIVPGTEHRYLLFVGEIMAGVAAAPTAPGARTSLERLAERLAELGADKKYAGGLGGMLLGKGDPSPYCTQFRFCCKALHAFITSQLLDNCGPIRTSDLEPHPAKGDKALKDMAYVSKDKSYVEEIGKEKVDSILMFLDQAVHNNNHTFVTSHSILMKMLVETLFSDKNELSAGILIDGK